MYKFPRAKTNCQRQKVSNCTEKLPEPPEKHEFCLSAICKFLLLWSILRRGKNVRQRKVKLSKQCKQQTSPPMEYFEKNKKQIGRRKVKLSILCKQQTSPIGLTIYTRLFRFHLLCALNESIQATEQPQASDCCTKDYMWRFSCTDGSA